MADASVVGIPDLRYGEVVVAFVVLVGGGKGDVGGKGEGLKEEELRSWVRGRLSGFLGTYFSLLCFTFLDPFSKKKISYR